MRWTAAEKGEKWPKSELEVCTFFRKIEFEFEHGLKEFEEAHRSK
jgi:hypothetical protein